MVWEDSNEDGVRDAQEPPLAGAILTLKASTGSVVRTYITESDGAYILGDLTTGTYLLTETDPPGYTSTTPHSWDIAVRSDCPYVVIDFGDHASEPPRGINGVVWNDIDADGRMNVAEPPLPEAILNLTVRMGTGGMTDTYTTGPDGIYTFEISNPGVAYLSEANPPGYPCSTTPDNWAITLLEPRIVTQNFGDRASCDVYAMTPSYSPGLFSPSMTPIDCTGNILGIVWNDLNGDKVRNAREAPLADAILTLRDSNNNLVGTYVTGADGSYLFSGLAPGIYLLTEVDPPGYGSTTSNLWGVELLDCSDVIVNFGDST